jgi:hypothetical protein
MLKTDFGFGIRLNGVGNVLPPSIYDNHSFDRENLNTKNLE